MRDIAALHPVLQKKLALVQDKCAAAGLKIGIGECLRTTAEQDALYAQGRTTPGSIVTNARGSTYSSMHQWGVAFDFYRNDGKGAFADGDGFFSKVGKLGQSVGLEWGGAWKSIVDKPHFQLPDWGSTPTKLKSLYGTPEQFMAVWPTAQAEPKVEQEEEIVTQEQFDQMMENYLARQAQKAPGSWSQEARSWAEKAGIVQGDGAGNKSYGGLVTKEVLTQMLYNMEQR